MEPARLTPDELKWAAASTGTTRAYLAGDDKNPVMYAFRARFPANFRNQPHFVWAKDGEVIIRVIGNGPSGVIPVPSKP